MRRALGLLVLAGCRQVLGIASPILEDASTDAAPSTQDAPRDAPPDMATNAVALDCLDALQHGATADGVVAIDPDGANAPFDAYCDMTTAGGGWTLVWVYGFTDYNMFTAADNAVTPRPTWGVPTANGTPTSTTVPADPTTPGALDFSRWPSLGAELLVTSNINQWIQCQPGTGSLVAKTSGSISCSMVKIVASQCTNVVPTTVELDGVGPALSAGGQNNYFYFWDGSTVQSWPTHDPCGSNSPNQLANITNPQGRIYLRRQ